MRELLGELMTALAHKRDCVHCSVVETRGSTPQKAGAAMLVFPDGSQRGTLGGGCVEAEVKQRSLRVLAEGGKSEVLTFCLDDNYGWDDGLICGGRMTILAEPLLASGTDPQTAAYYQRLQERVEQGVGGTEVIVLSPQDEAPVGTRYLFDGEGSLIAQRGNGPVPDAVERHLIPLAQRPRPSAQHGFAFLPILPRITLLIVGGGHVGQAVASLASEVDFDIWVLDDRAAYANIERFPTASRVIVGDIGTTLERMAHEEIPPSVYAIIVTRGHNHDEEALYHLAGTPAAYVGMIGSKRKIKLIYEDLLARGLAPEALERIHAPLGFDIGSQTVPEIAISIVAELIACRNRGSTESKPRLRVPVSVS